MEATVSLPHKRYGSFPAQSICAVLPERAEAVIGFRAAPELQERIDELAEKSAEGQLTEAERSEYAGYVRANKFVAILQQHARRLIEARAPIDGTQD